MNSRPNRAVSFFASIRRHVVDVIFRREERALTADLERWIAERTILSITFSYPQRYPASKPCPERVVIKGDGWRAVYLESGMKLTGDARSELLPLLSRLEQEHILNLQNLLRFMCEHSRNVRTEVAGFDASSRILGYVHPDEMSAERATLQAAAQDGFDLDFKWEVVKILPA